jgi:serine/threonine protein kinase
MTPREPDHPGQQTRPSEPPERLLHCSGEHTLLVRWREDAQAEELVKVFERGSLSDAQREATLGRELNLPGLVRYRSAGQDPATGRPCLVMDYHPGRDLEALVGEQGPFPPRAAARIAGKLASILASLHRAGIPSAPHGLAHGDVKPSNILLDLERGPSQVLLLDLEHAVALEPERGERNGVETGRFTGGTHGFAPPEAYRGLPPNRAFESFAFGATLHFLLTGEPPFQGPDPRAVAAAVLAGCRRGWLAAGLPNALGDLVRACLSPSPEARPTMALAAETLGEFLTEQTESERGLDLALRHLQTAELGATQAVLEGLDSQNPASRTAELRRLLERRRRLISRHPGPPDLVQGDLLSRAAGLLTAIPRLSAWLMRFPAQPTALARRLEFRDRAAELLVQVPPEVARFKREVRFAEAKDLLRTTTSAVRLALSLPGPLPVRADVPARLPGLMQRDPLRFLHLAMEDVVNAAEIHSRLLGQLEQAEAQLNLDEASRVIESIASIYGGASPVVADLKDRLHRLGFYLEEFGGPRQKLNALEEQLSLANKEQDLTPLRDFLQICADRAPLAKFHGTRTKSGLRRLQRGLHDLLREFPNITPCAGPAVEVLDQSLGAVSDLAWELLGDARSKLAAIPIPVRPLQSILNRLDTLRLLDVLVDRPDRSRAQLMDEVESIRLKVQQARNTRDRIARGAEEAMARGHWTTALYDMKRAVGHLELADTEPSPTDRQLMEKYQEVKRTKQEIEEAIRRNLELARTHATLLDQPDSSSEERLQILQNRRECLQLMVKLLKGERANPYLHDLRDVEVNIVQERTVHAELLLDESSDTGERMGIAARTLEMLQQSVKGTKPVGRIQRLITHWQRQHDRAQEEVEKGLLEARVAHSRRRRILWMYLAVTATVSTLLFLAWWLWA